MLDVRRHLEQRAVWSSGATGSSLLLEVVEVLFEEAESSLVACGESWVGYGFGLAGV